MLDGSQMGEMYRLVATNAGWVPVGSGEKAWRGEEKSSRVLPVRCSTAGPHVSTGGQSQGPRWGAAAATNDRGVGGERSGGVVSKTDQDPSAAGSESSQPGPAHPNNQRRARWGRRAAGPPPPHPSGHHHRAPLEGPPAEERIWSPLLSRCFSSLARMCLP